MRETGKEMMSVGNRKRYMQDSFHERLRCLWIASGLTQKQIAERIGAERKSVNKWISGEFNPNLMSFMRLCRLFHVSADWLLFGKVDKGGGEKESVMLLEQLLKATREGLNIEQTKMRDEGGMLEITFLINSQHVTNINSTRDSGINIIMDMARNLDSWEEKEGTDEADRRGGKGWRTKRRL